MGAKHSSLQMQQEDMTKFCFEYGQQSMEKNTSSSDLKQDMGKLFFDDNVKLDTQSDQDAKQRQEKLESTKLFRSGTVARNNDEDGFKPHRMGLISFDDILNIETRGQQIMRELQKHPLGDEEMEALVQDLVEPIDVLGMILNKKGYN